MGCGASKVPQDTGDARPTEALAKTESAGPPKPAAPAPAAAKPAVASGGGHDIMISYAHKDVEAMRALRKALQAAGYSVWVDDTGLSAGSPFLQLIGEAILQAKVIVFLLSVTSAKSKYCKDEIALAYMSGKPIFPACLGTFPEMNDLLAPSTKLILSSIQWTFLTSGEGDGYTQGDGTANLVSGLKLCPELSQEDKSERSTLPPSLRRATSHDTNAEPSTKNDTNFWTRHFADKLSVEWQDFADAFASEYAAQIAAHDALAGRTEWLLTLVHRHVFSREAPTLRAFEEFRNMGCAEDSIRVDAEKIDRSNIFFALVLDMVTTEYAVETIAGMQGYAGSGSRLEALQRLAESSSISIVQSLIALVLSTDPDSRALALIALGRLSVAQLRMRRKGVAISRRLDALVARPYVETCLADADRVVREAAASTLGAMRQPESVAPLIRLWRSDPISNVREAASTALAHISQEVESGEAAEGTNTAAEEMLVSQMLMREVGATRELLEEVYAETASRSRTASSAEPRATALKGGSLSA